MPIKDALRTCTCKYCNAKFTMFVNSAGELIFFPDNTVRAAKGYYELLDHLRKEHRETYNLFTFLTAGAREQYVKESFDIA